ncbi:MAG: hypothetical protein EOT05_00240 [Candidatus Microsaccharimonas sossegonensis]|uniref:Uncharacterized protein n=1 Tax=Candidatus Microsaccharimonas sossegonensis TaxID=2506948 RepID=A0A4Q0AHX3_9BACT|nr:MAG: hypothetical protein EOT05_00240 [Candidatus Microsaccharimonas sossegonensis]
MQDIDFDEIDRAVNSLTNSAAAPSTPNVADISPAPNLSTVATSPESSISVASPSLPVARRSSGRFMDVVHPSSDMRPTIPERPVPSAPNLHREDDASRNDIPDRPESTTVPNSVFHWPDPIDIAASAPASAATSESPLPNSTADIADTPRDALEQENHLNDDVVADEGTTPLESPFLPGTKVDKRPLGAFSGSDEGLPMREDTISLSTEPSQHPVEDEVTPEVVTEHSAIEEHDTHLEELHPDVLALDRHDIEEPLLEATNLSATAPTKVTDDVPAVPTSISQQYVEQPSSTAQQSGAIFDTDAYHLPLTHAPKKHAGVLIVVWILTLILVGGGIGAGIYFILLPTLR